MSQETECSELSSPFASAKPPICAPIQCSAGPPRIKRCGLSSGVSVQTTEPPICQPRGIQRPNPVVPPPVVVSSGHSTFSTPPSLPDTQQRWIPFAVAGLGTLAIVLTVIVVAVAERGDQAADTDRREFLDEYTAGQEPRTADHEVTARRTTAPRMSQMPSVGRETKHEVRDASRDSGTTRQAEQNAATRRVRISRGLGTSRETELETGDRDVQTEPVARELRWERYTDTDGAFSVLFPGTPTVEAVEPIRLPGLDNYHEASLYLHDGSVGFSVYHGDYEETFIPSIAERREQGLDSLVEWLRDSNGAKLISKNSISLAEFSGRRLILSGSDDEHAEARIYVVYHRLYILIAQMPKDGNNGAELERFLGSFTLLPGRLDLVKVTYNWKVASARAKQAVAETHHSTLTTIQRRMSWHQNEDTSLAELEVTEALVELGLVTANESSQNLLEQYLRRIRQQIQEKSSQDDAAPDHGSQSEQWQQCPGEGNRYVCNNGTVYVGARNNIPIPCAICGGRGVVAASHDRSPTVSDSSGSGHRSRCPSCHGTGRCQTCSGAGRTLSCSSCGGDGRAGGNNRFCSNCDGTGRQTCRQCAGRGTGRCSTCGGSRTVRD